MPSNCWVLKSFSVVSLCFYAINLTHSEVHLLHFSFNFRDILLKLFQNYANHLHCPRFKSIKQSTFKEFLCLFLPWGRFDLFIEYNNEYSSLYLPLCLQLLPHWILILAHSYFVPNLINSSITDIVSYFSPYLQYLTQLFTYLIIYRFKNVYLGYRIC